MSAITFKVYRLFIDLKLLVCKQATTECKQM